MSETARARDYAHIFFDHLAHEFLELYFRTPAQALLRLAGVAEKRLDFGGPEVARIDFDQHAVGPLVDADLVDSVSARSYPVADVRECMLDEFAHRMRFSGGEHEVVG